MFDAKNVYDGDWATFEKDGFTIRVSISGDHDPDTSWIGEFSDTPKKGAINHHATGTWLGRSWQGCEFFNPANYDETEPEMAQRDYKRMVAYYQDEWSMVGMVVTANREGIELGSKTIWGIESDSGDDYLTSLVNEELVDEAIYEGQEMLAKLVASVKETA